MHTQASLNQLSHAQKDELILLLQFQVATLQAAMQEMQAVVQELQSRLNKNSRNSSKPPSSDGINKPAPKSLRVAGQNPSGGQKGHAGSTLCQAKQADKVVIHNVPDQCQACQSPLPLSYLAEKRQVFDLPSLRFEVTEHQAMQAVCRCGQVHTGEFPEEVRATVQYGPRAQAAMVHLNQNHVVSVKRTAQLMSELFDLPVSQGTVVKCTQAGARILEPTVQRIGQGTIAQGVVHADETGMRVDKTLYWLHVLATDTLTWLGCHPKRGTEAFASFELLQQFQGILVHDGWIAYKALACTHALCNAHHLRELTYLFEEQNQAWAGDMIELLRHANHLDNQHCANGQCPDYDAPEYTSQVRDLRDLYEAILADAQTHNPPAHPTGKRGRPKQTKAHNLIRRLVDYGDDVWRFMTQVDVPFTNNVAEQAVRMPKVKQKVSGCFRTLAGVQAYCIIRSYCTTLQKQGVNTFEALVAAFKGTVPQPSFG